MKEYLQLFWVNFLVSCRSIAHFFGVAFRYYGNRSFRKADIATLLVYLFDNPFAISKSFLMKRGEEDVYAYGETPLPSLEHIAKECRLSEADTLFELGCGCGRTCFWLNSFIGCQVVGIDYVPEFIERADRVKERYTIDGVTFRCEDIQEADLTGATAIYLYGSCLKEEEIVSLVKKFRKLPSGTKIITVSYPLTDYADDSAFEVMKCFIAPYTWGKADVFLQIVK